MTYQSWNCSEHGHFKYKEKYRPNCQECFEAMKEELERGKRVLSQVNSERVNALYQLEELRKVKGEMIVNAILKKI